MKRTMSKTLAHSRMIIMESSLSADKAGIRQLKNKL